MTTPILAPDLPVQSRRSWMRGVSDGIWIPICIYVIARVASAIAIVWASRYQIATEATTADPTRSYFVHHPMPADPGYLGVITNWDGQWYRYIAELGYTPFGLDGSISAGWAWAFPPGYPVAVAAFMFLTGLTFPVAAGLVSTALGAFAMVVMYRLASIHGGQLNAVAIVAATSFFVTSPLLQAAYSESLALLLVAASLYLIDRERPWLAIMPVLALCLTRQIAPPLALVALAVVVLARQKPLDRLQRLGWLALVVLSTAGVFAWPMAASALGGGLGADRVSVMTSDAPFGWFSVFAEISVWAISIPVALALTVIAVSWRKASEWGTALSCWSASYFLYVLVATPPHTGILRYILLAFPLGMVLVGRREWSARRRMTCLAFGCVGLMCLQVIWIRYSFVYTPPFIMP